MLASLDMNALKFPFQTRITVLCVCLTLIRVQIITELLLNESVSVYELQEIINNLVDGVDDCKC